MINHYAAWKYALILLVVIIGGLYAMPNIYGTDPAVQITAKEDGILDQTLLDSVTKDLEAENIPYTKAEIKGEYALIRFADIDTQLRATERVRHNVGNNYNVAQNLASASPEWLENIGALPMFLGLDLRGGLHFLLQVDMDKVVAKSLESFAAEIPKMLRENNIKSKGTKASKGIIEIRFDSEDMRNKALTKIRSEFKELEVKEYEQDDKYLYLRAKMTEVAVIDTKKNVIKQNITTLRKRLNATGVAEPIIQQQGADRIVLQLPGVQCSPCAKTTILRSTATLEFHPVNDDASIEEALKGNVPRGSAIYYRKDGTPIILKKFIIVRGKNISSAVSGVDSDSASPAVFINLDGRGASSLTKFTKKNIKKRMAVVYIEDRVDTIYVDGKQQDKTIHKEYVVNAATIQDVLSNRFQITGLESPKEAQELALFIRSGALAAPVSIIEERTIGPSSGQDNIDKGMYSIIIGIVLVVAFMMFWYRSFGVVANVALIVNLVLIAAVLSMLQATLTLPGIAGIVLTVGMAVDANVLIFERIREEVRNGNTPQASIHAGYEKALTTIADANITTLIASVILFIYGTGPVKGFAITLSIGILTSMFTAIMVTRAIVNIYVRNRRMNKLWI